jgi:hypothetical protein
MSDALSLGWSNAKARSAAVTYQRVLGFNMLLHVFVGMSCILAPYWVSSTVGLPEPIPDGWVRGWGATLMLVTALYVPGLIAPERHRMPNLIGILGRLWMAFIWTLCGGAFLTFAVFDFVWALIIGFFYLRLFTRVITSRP